MLKYLIITKVPMAINKLNCKKFEFN